MTYHTFTEIQYRIVLEFHRRLVSRCRIQLLNRQEMASCTVSHQLNTLPPAVQPHDFECLRAIMKLYCLCSTTLYFIQTKLAHLQEIFIYAHIDTRVQETTSALWWKRWIIMMVVSGRPRNLIGFEYIQLPNFLQTTINSNCSFDKNNQKMKTKNSDYA